MTSRISMLNKVQSFSCLLMSTAIKLFSSIYFIKSIGAKSVLRLKESGEMKHEKLKHGATLKGMIGSNLSQRIDYLLPTMNFNKRF